MSPKKYKEIKMIHKYFQNGYYIVLDVNSGAVHVVDELFYNMLDHVSEDLAEECPEEIIRAFSDRWSERGDPFYLC